MDLAPVAAFAVTGYAALALVDPPSQARVIALVIINANVIVRAVTVLARMVLRPRFATFRFVGPLRRERELPVLLGAAPHGGVGLRILHRRGTAVARGRTGRPGVCAEAHRTRRGIHGGRARAAESAAGALVALRRRDRERMAADSALVRRGLAHRRHRLCHRGLRSVGHGAAGRVRVPDSVRRW